VPANQMDSVLTAHGQFPDFRCPPCRTVGGLKCTSATKESKGQRDLCNFMISMHITSDNRPDTIDRSGVERGIFTRLAPVTGRVRWSSPAEQQFGPRAGGVC